MDDLIDTMQAAGELMAHGEALQGAVKQTMVAVYSFFQNFDAYTSAQKQRLRVATEDIDTLKTEAATIKQQNEITLFLELVEQLFSYSMMWMHAEEAKEILNGKGQSFTIVSDAVQEYAKAVHEWLNGETQSLCTYHGGCREVRAKLFAEVEKTVDYCNERLTEQCEKMHGGFAPSGRFCKFIMRTKEEKDKGLQDQCKAIMPPTRGLKYHQNHPEGRGIFY